MIVRNEEERLATSLESVIEYVDEIVIVDTGSSDRTVDIAKKYTDNVFCIDWEGDFSAARNFAKSCCSGEWILSLDADEKLDCRDGTLRELIAADQEHALFFLPLDSQSTECLKEYDRFMVVRFFRNKPEYSFAGKIHEQVMIPKPDEVGFAANPIIVHAAVPLRQRNRRRYRNLTLLRRAIAVEPNNIFLLYYIGIEWLGLKRWDKALPIFQSVVKALTDEQLLFRAPAIRGLIACLSAVGKNDDALRFCMDETLHYPAYTDLFFDGGILLEKRGEYEAAVKWFDMAIQCGLPPAIFSHTCGTESYLALYHLGYCHEKLARFEQAGDCYQRALTANPDYVYPLYRLFLLQLTNLPAHTLYEHYRTAGFLKRQDWSDIIADLFFEAGYPELAAACGNEAAATGNRRNHLQFKYLIYCGRLAEALTLVELDRALQEGASRELINDELVALLLSGNAKAAKSKALALWRHPTERGAALALLNLISIFETGQSCCKPEKCQQNQFSETILAVVENCLRSCNSATGNPSGPNYRHLAVSGLRLITGLSDSGFEIVAAYLQTKMNHVSCLLNHRNFPAGRLYL